jgi:hypothetical protein
LAVGDYPKSSEGGLTTMIPAILLSFLLAAEEPHVSLAAHCEVQASNLIAGDPLLVKLSVTNRGDAATWLRTPTFSSGNWVEFRRFGLGGFVAARTKSGGGDVMTLGFAIGENQVVTDYDFLLAAENQFLTAPGEYEIRAGTITPDGTHLYSEPIRIQVIARDPAIGKHISEDAKYLSWAFDAYYPTSRDVYNLRLLKLEDQLAPCELRTMLVWTRMLRTYRADNPHSDMQLRALLDVARIVDSITAEVIHICVASRLSRSGKCQEAIDVLSEFSERNATVESIRRTCESQLVKRPIVGRNE